VTRTGRLPVFATENIRVSHQPQDRKGAWLRCAAVAACSSRRGDWI